MISDELRERVKITDEGIVHHIDPDTGVYFETYNVTFTVMRNGVEHGLTLASNPIAMNDQAVYDAVIQSGMLSVLERAGLI